MDRLCFFRDKRKCGVNFLFPHKSGYWVMGEVCERFMKDCYADKNVVQGIWEVYEIIIQISIFSPWIILRRII